MSVIDDIRKRHEAAIRKFPTIKSELQADEDRGTLLKLLDEVAEEAEMWRGYSFDNLKAVTFMDAADCANQIKALLESTQEKEG